MRYTTARFGEVVYLLGEFVEGRGPGEITMEIFDLAASGTILLTSSGCEEVLGSNAGGFSTYAWPSYNVADPVTEPKQYLYKMLDTIPANGRVQKGKYTVGGHPDDSARNRYNNEVHLSPAGSPLPTAATMSAATLDFITGTPYKIHRTTGSFTGNGFVVGMYVQVDNPTSVNSGVFGPITAITGGGADLEFAGTPFSVLSGATGVSVVAKTYVFDLGTQEHPVDNLLDARQIATLLELFTYHLRGGMYLLIGFPHDSWVFVGDDPDADLVEFWGSATTVGCAFTQVGILGELSGRIVCTRCILTGPVTGVEGVFNDTGTSGSIQIAAGGSMTGLQIASRNLFGTTLDFSAGTCNFLGGSVLGLWTIANMSGADILGMALIGSVITFATSCTGGTAQIGGVGEMNVLAGVGTTIIDQLLRGTRLDEHVSNVIPFVAT